MSIHHEAPWLRILKGFFIGLPVVLAAAGILALFIYAPWQYSIGLIAILFGAWFAAIIGDFIRLKMERHKW